MGLGVLSYDGKRTAKETVKMPMERPSSGLGEIKNRQAQPCGCHVVNNKYLARTGRGREGMERMERR